MKRAVLALMTLMCFNVFAEEKAARIYIHNETDGTLIHFQIWAKGELLDTEINPGQDPVYIHPAQNTIISFPCVKGEEVKYRATLHLRNGKTDVINAKAKLCDVESYTLLSRW